jgi:lipoate-protein ligase A
MLMRAKTEPELQVRDFDFDSDLIRTVTQTQNAQVSIYPFDHRAVVAGRGTDLEQEISLDRVLADNIPIYRRMGGGCSVFLDPGNLIVSMAFPAKGFGNVGTLFNQASQTLIQGLTDAGIEGVYQDGVSDLVIQDRKIGGSCFYRAKGLAYYSAALLVSPDLEGMDTYLSHPPREPEYRKGRSHAEFVIGLNGIIPHISIDRLNRNLLLYLDPGAFVNAA